MDKKSIDRLLVGMRNGSNQDFSDLYVETKNGIFAFLYTYYKDYYLAEDAMQDVYLKIKMNIDKYMPGTNGKAWMLEIAKNTALNELKSKRHQILELNEDILSNEHNDNSMEITDFINHTLPEEDARIVTMHVILGYKHREIGKILNMPTGTVTSKYKRAMDKIREAWKATQ